MSKLKLLVSLNYLDKGRIFLEGGVEVWKNMGKKTWANPQHSQPFFLLPPPFSVLHFAVYFSSLPSPLFLFLYSVLRSAPLFSGSVMTLFLCLSSWALYPRSSLSCYFHSSESLKLPHPSLCLGERTKHFSPVLCHFRNVTPTICSASA